MPSAGLKTIIALSFVLALGFLLVILSCALFKDYYPLLVVATYVLAPVPNWICSHCANPDDFESSSSAVLDLGKFCTGFLVVMGIGEFPPCGAGVSRRRSREEMSCVLTISLSAPRGSSARGTHPDGGDDHVDSRWAPHLRHHHQLRHVLPGGAGLLGEWPWNRMAYVPLMNAGCI